MRVAYADGVFEELVSLSFYIAEADEDAAQRFLDACDETFRFLAENCFVGSIRKFNNPNLSETRMWRISGYRKYLVFYHPLSDGVKILHVIHSARDYNQVFEDENPKE
jgi:toxin ParE1/3/4